MHTASSHSQRVHTHNVLLLFKCQIKHSNTYIVHRPTTLHGVLVLTGRSVLPMIWKAHWLLPQDQKAKSEWSKCDLLTWWQNRSACYAQASLLHTRCTLHSLRSSVTAWYKNPWWQQWVSIHDWGVSLHWDCRQCTAASIKTCLLIQADWDRNENELMKWKD